MQPVRYVNFARFAERYGGELQAVMTSVVASGVYIGGDELAAFEREFAAFCGTAHAVGVANGTDALELTLRALGVGPGDEVIVPANTAMPTALAVDHAGAKLVLVDAEDDTGMMDVAAVRAAVTPATRAIVPVHLYGHPTDVDALRAIARAHGAYLLEDAAHAHGARYRGLRCGGLGDAAAFSFYPTKNLGAIGDGGCVTTDDAELAGRLRALRNNGLAANYDHPVAGFNSRLDPLQAAILRWKLARLDDWNARRAALAARYANGLADMPGLVLPVVRDWATPVWHAYPIRVHDAAHGDKPGAAHANGLGTHGPGPHARDASARALLDAGVETNVHYRTPIHLQSCYAERGWRRGQFPVSERRADTMLSLPLDPFHTDAEIDRVIAALREHFTAG